MIDVYVCVVSVVCVFFEAYDSTKEKLYKNFSSESEDVEQHGPFQMLRLLDNYPRKLSSRF